MMKPLAKKIGLALAAALFASAAFAQTATTVLDQNPAPAPSQTVNPELMTQSINVAGGTLYVSTLAQSRNNGGNGQPQGVSSVFVPSSSTGGGSVGAAGFSGSQASVGVTAGLIVAARTGASGTGRIALTIYNGGSATVYLGATSGVLTTTGTILPPGASVTLNTQAAVYGISGSASQAVGVTETF